MAAAQYLGQYHIDIHIVEKKKRLGGNAFDWACMATDTCQHCSACLSAELAQTVSAMPNVHLLLDNEITGAGKEGNRYIIDLKRSASERLEADRVILATGLAPFRPDGLLGQAWKKHDNVITTDQLNRILKQDGLSKYLREGSDPKIAFIQCVGSRNRRNNRDYCSQVCCKISARHINKIRHLHPDADITMFYMDLQVIGKEMRNTFQTLSGNIRLVQGVPGEIHDSKTPGRLTLIHEDGLSMARKADDFDLIVLSIGIHPAGTAPEITELFGLETDDFGFFPANGNDLPENLAVAGSAAGPKDILSAVQEGQNAAFRVLDTLGIKEVPKGTIAVFGEDSRAEQAAAAVAETGYECRVFGRKPKDTVTGTGFTYESVSEIISVKGLVNDYTVTYRSGDTIRRAGCNALILCESAAETPAGLELELPADRLYSLSAFEKTISTSPDSIPQRLVFWMDYSGPEPKDTSRALLCLAKEMAGRDRTVTVFMEKILVHTMTGQRLYDAAKKAGVTFLRLNSPADGKVTAADDGLAYTVAEATLKNIRLSLASDWLIIPHKKEPSNTFPFLAGLLGERTDREGYLQPPDVRHRLTRSFRKGIYYAGSGHDDIDGDDFSRELVSICADIAGLKDTGAEAAHEPVTIDEKKCARCLTCLRVCPHTAIVLREETKPFIDPGACFACGLCIASCPALAIEKKDQTDETLLQKVTRGRKAVFACERSGALAAKAAGVSDGVDIIPVPCACRISPSLVLKSLLKGAEKVILAGCHQDNCRSEKGGAEARYTAQTVTAFPGIDASKIRWEPVAANEPEKFRQVTA